ncbi:hypothetical protein MIND_01133900 [Mycena indigotica]|uniref:Uncharacterized protein n=1 Tax=Mycena indigotica TaxID=2126181 RepID=A0A8H6S625_9AGAR|nr:uncharacterized protein MIND_01133900 [Mycena indigotica]KAF7293554.1 hypothetical protein MIND_01133900 [Mycena indigotica]
MASSPLFKQLYGRYRLEPFAGFESSSAGLNVQLEEPFNQRVASRRYVKLADEYFELWSPNSTMKEFLPGLPHSTYHLRMDTNPDYRRFDGSWGRFDYTQSPQYIGSNPPYIPYIRRAHTLKTNDSLYIVYAPLMDFWEKSTNQLGRVTAKGIQLLQQVTKVMQGTTQLLLKKSTTTQEASSCIPTPPTADMLESLTRLRRWDDVVDDFTAVQRHLRLTNAWINWVNQETGLKSSTSSFPNAKEGYMGVWVNGMPAERIRRLLLARIPCFIVAAVNQHDLPATEPILTSFLSNTETERLLECDNPYMKFARQIKGFRVGRTKLSGAIIYGLTPPFDGEKMRRASSLYRPPSPPPVKLPTFKKKIAVTNQPPISTSVPSSSVSSQLSTRVAGSSTLLEKSSRRIIQLPPGGLEEAMRLADEAEEIDDGSDWDEVDDPSDEERPSAPTEPQFQPIAPKTLSISSDKVDWIVPPPVHEKQTSFSNMHFYIGKTADGKMAMYQGRERGGKQYYDRANGRVLVMHNYKLPRGVIEPERYGFPPPPLYVFIRGRHSEWMPTKPTTWLYYTSGKKKGQNVGDKAPIPNADQLPSLSDKKHLKRSQGQPADSSRSRPSPIHCPPPRPRSRSPPNRPASSVPTIGLVQLDAEMTVLQSDVFAHDANRKQLDVEMTELVRPTHVPAPSQKQVDVEMTMLQADASVPIANRKQLNIEKTESVGSASSSPKQVNVEMTELHGDSALRPTFKMSRMPSTSSITLSPLPSLSPEQRPTSASSSPANIVKAEGNGQAQQRSWEYNSTFSWQLDSLRAKMVSRTNVPNQPSPKSMFLEERIGPRKRSHSPSSRNDQPAKKKRRNPPNKHNQKRAVARKLAKDLVFSEIRKRQSMQVDGPTITTEALEMLASSSSRKGRQAEDDTVSLGSVESE